MHASYSGSSDSESVAMVGQDEDRLSAFAALSLSSVRHLADPSGLAAACVSEASCIPIMTLFKEAS